jgi:hypothetical protein
MEVKRGEFHQSRARRTIQRIFYNSCTLDPHHLAYLKLSNLVIINTPTMADRDLTEDEVADLKEAFAMFDINGDGKGFLSD